jgi:serine/threonine protein kinase
VSTQAYKAPELLLKYKQYGYSADMWGVGMYLAGFVFNQKKIFGCKFGFVIMLAHSKKGGPACDGSKVLFVNM